MPPRSRLGRRSSGWFANIALAVMLLFPPPAVAAEATQIVLQEADVAPDFVFASRGDSLRANYRLTRVSYRRVGRHAGEIEQTGLLGVTSLVLVVRDGPEARKAFDEIVPIFLKDAVDVGSEPVGEAVKAGLRPGSGPFDPATKVLVFLARNVVGVVIGGTYDAAVDVGDLVPLARLMAERATK